MEYLKIWTSFGELLEPLNDSERGRLFTAMLEYAATGEAQDLKGNERFVWPAARQSIDNTREKSEQMRANASKPKQTGANDSKPEQTAAKPSSPFDKEKEKEKVKEKVKEYSLTGVKEKRKRFSPPTLEEVSAYCKERGNKVDPERFIAYYESKGWTIGKDSPMRDWRAAVRTWEQRDRNGSSSQNHPRLLRSQDYEQREYHEEELVETLGVDDLFKAGAS